MKVAFIIRSTLHTVPGGDTIQVEQTAKELRHLGLVVDIIQTNKQIDYGAYDYFHFFNITRPADILFHLERLKAPAFISPIFIDYSEYDKNYRKGIRGFILSAFSTHGVEYIKTMGRWLTGKDSLQSRKFIWKGQRRSIGEILEKVTAVLPNSNAEKEKLQTLATKSTPYIIVPNGIDTQLFHTVAVNQKNRKLVLCAARIEGIKNQANLIRALNNTEFTLWLIGSAGPNHQEYYQRCRKIAASNIHFKGHLPQEQLAQCYEEAGIHVLPSWFETCGLSSLEAAAMGCNIVITDKGYTRDYFGDDAFYCDPSDPASIYHAVKDASEKEFSLSLQNRIREKYTWQIAAKKTLEVYNQYRVK
jgi:glycosyltransferase involved in cell wall biosynthesis